MPDSLAGTAARRRLGALLAAGALLLATTSVYADTPLQRLYVSPDTTVVLGSQTLLASQVARDEVPVTTVNLGPLPSSANVAAYNRRESGQQLFVLEVTTALAGGITAGPRDVVAFNDPGYAIVLDGAARGIPSGVAIDALATVGNDLLVSFDTTVNVGGIEADDVDLVRVTPSSIAIFGFISGTGVNPALDLDGVERLRNGHLLLSFDGSGSAKGITFDDDDLIEYDPSNETFELVYDGVARHAAWAAADLDAVAADEPFTPTPTTTPSRTATPTGTETPTAAATSTPPSTATPPFTSTPPATDTPEPTRTLESTATATPTFSRTPSTTNTATPSRTATATSSVTPANTPSPTVPPTVHATPAPGFIAGDTNCDGAVTAADMPALIGMIFNEAPTVCGVDVNCDRRLNNEDVVALLGRIFASEEMCEF